MNDPTIECPNCHNEIKLTESLAAPLLQAIKQQYEQQLSEKEQEVARRESAIREQQAAVAKAQATIDAEISAKLKQERAAIVAEEGKKARQLLATDLEARAKELADLQDVLKQRDLKLAEAQKTQAELLKKQRELDDARRELELTVEKRVNASLAGVRDKAKLEAEEQLKLKVAEKEQVIGAMQKQIEELRRRADQASQQLQGEVQELELEATLRTRFPLDVIEPVPKGEFGGDTLHRVCGPTQQTCGTILWESKRTKHWSDGWLTKLREDQRAAKAELSVIVSQALPNQLETFDLIDGVWVTSPRHVVPVAIALRHTLIELSQARQASEGQQTKMELIYRYLTGPQFRHRVQAIVEKFSDMMEDLEKERKSITKSWAKREQQLRLAIESAAGMYGDLQGIAGKSLQEIDGLGLPRLDNVDADGN